VVENPVPRPRGVLVGLILGQLLLLASLGVWLTMFGLSFMAFDSGTDNAGPWVFVGAVFSYAPLVLICSASAWVAFAKRRYRGAMIAMGLPVVLAVLAFGIILV